MNVTVNWQRLALNLRSAGVPCTRVDDFIGEWRGYTAKLANATTKEPKFSAGLRLLDLHTDKCGAEKTAALRGSV